MLGKSIPWKFIAQNIDKRSQKNSLDCKSEDAKRRWNHAAKSRKKVKKLFKSISLELDDLFVKDHVSTQKSDRIVNQSSNYDFND